MGTRADFYLGRGKKAKWLGSIGWDGYPTGIDKKLLRATNKETFVNLLNTFFKGRDDVSLPTDGWPWPWENSQTTDYSYAFDKGEVWVSCFGYKWIATSELLKRETYDDHPMWDAAETKTTVFPNMKSKQKVTVGKRSGLIVLGR